MSKQVKVYSKNVIEILLIVLGNLILSIGICAFITPHGIIVGGASGIGLLVKELTGIPMSYVVYLINIVMFCVGFKVFGKKFAFGTIISTFVFPTFLTIFENLQFFQEITSDVLLSSIYAGLFIGVGIGLVLRMGASTGGMDIPPLIISKKTGISVAIILNACDCVILATQVPFSNVEQVLYGIMVVLMTAIIMDKMMLIGQTNVQVTIISPKWKEIKDVVFEGIDRGCTLINVTTGYRLVEQNAVMAVVTKRELHTLLGLIQEIDPEAFIISNETHSIRGRGFTLPSVDL